MMIMKKNMDGIPLLTTQQIVKAPTLAERHRIRDKTGLVKNRVQITVDGDVLKWLKRSGNAYQVKINHILRDIMELSETRK
jgi:uncharacterized protein (DUF4415 family)